MDVKISLECENIPREGVHQPTTCNNNNTLPTEKAALPPDFNRDYSHIGDTAYCIEDPALPAYVELYPTKEKEAEEDGAETLKNGYEIRENENVNNGEHEEDADSWTKWAYRHVMRKDINNGERKISYPTGKLKTAQKQFLRKHSTKKEDSLSKVKKLVNNLERDITILAAGSMVLAICILFIMFQASNNTSDVNLQFAYDIYMGNQHKAEIKESISLNDAIAGHAVPSQTALA